MTEPLTDAEIKELATVWYKKLDVHAPVEELLPLLATDEEGLKLLLPEGPIYGVKAFTDWYEGVIRLYFDEVHNLKEVNPTIEAEQAETKIVVKWDASYWNPPEPNSQRILSTAYQTWQVIRSSQTQKAIIKTYIVGDFIVDEGSAPLPVI